ncbi:phage integrase N-terminal SAM-like domain-containing protein [candidate division KSB1 bacterium]|nr:phage integrase N-terminal SAM-like domain-containing protein [candidate division KSB1 bacterium]
MKTIIEQFRKELIDVALYRDDTVTTYIACIYQFVTFVKDDNGGDPVQATASQLKQWMIHVKKTGISNSRLSHYKCALTAFFAFLIKIKQIDMNPADALFPMRKTKV